MDASADRDERSPEFVDDVALLEAWRGGDTDAGRSLFERHFECVYRFFFNKVDDPPDDLVQQTFLACVESRDRFCGRSTFKTFLLGIAKNKLYKHVRGRVRSREAGPPSSIPASFSMVSILAQRERELLLLQALRTLPLDLQTALELAYWENMTDRELASTLELPVGTVKSRLRKARKLLGEAMTRGWTGAPHMVSESLRELDRQFVQVSGAPSVV